MFLPYYVIVCFFFKSVEYPTIFIECHLGFQDVPGTGSRAVCKSGGVSLNVLHPKLSNSLPYEECSHSFLSAIKTDFLGLQIVQSHRSLHFEGS